MLKHIKLNPIEKIVQIIYECDESVLTKDLILELQKFIPTNDEVCIPNFEKILILKKNHYCYFLN